MEALELTKVLSDVIREYQKHLHKIDSPKGNLSIPIPTNDDDRYISIVQKNGNILIHTSKNTDGNYYGVPILNGDYLYTQLETIKRIYKKTIHRMSGIFTKNHEAWIHIKYTQDTEKFLLSPAPNPENFVADLVQGNLPQMYRIFLHDVGLALPEAKEIEIPEDDYGM